MEDFEFVSPTHFVFGPTPKRKVTHVGLGAAPVLLHYGGQSAISRPHRPRVRKSLEPSRHQP